MALPAFCFSTRSPAQSDFSLVLCAVTFLWAQAAPCLASSVRCLQSRRNAAERTCAIFDLGCLVLLCFCFSSEFLAASELSTGRTAAGLRRGSVPAIFFW